MHKTGYEVFNNYGAKPNDELLLGYGFVLPGNPEDFVSLKMGTSAEDTRPHDILEAVGLSPKKAHYVKRNITELPGEILAQLRVLVAEDEELDSLNQKSENIAPAKGRTEQRGRANELVADSRWKEILSFVSWPNELEMLESLGGMLEMKAEGMQDALSRTQEAAKRPAKRTKSEDEGKGEIREHIREMIEVYLASK